MTRRSYHHGDLRNALIDAARALLAERGPGGFALADAAKAAGVSASAPYRHFADKDALIAAVIEAGRGALAHALHAARLAPDKTPLQALDAVALAYLDFARAEPALFSAIFAAGQSADPSQAAHPNEDEIFAALLGASMAVLAMLPPERRPPPLMAAHHLWMLVHGAAMLFANPARPAPADPRALVEAALGVYLRGLGVLPS